MLVRLVRTLCRIRHALRRVSFELPPELPTSMPGQHTLPGHPAVSQAEPPPAPSPSPKP